MELVSLTIEQLYRAHQALEHDRASHIAALPEQVADRLLAHCLTQRQQADRERMRVARARRRGDVEQYDDLT